MEKDEKNEKKEKKENEKKAKKETKTVEEMKTTIRKNLNYLKRLNVVLDNHKEMMQRRQNAVVSLTLQSEDFVFTEIGLKVTELLEGLNEIFNDTTVRSFKSTIDRYETEFNDMK